MALADIQLAADNALDALVSELSLYQVAHYGKRGRYWQGILTPPSPPVDGVQKAPDLTQKPSDGSDWTELGLPALLPVSVAVDVYNGPLGPGYIARGRFVFGGRLYERTINVGPEVGRSQNWTDVTPKEEG